MREEATFRFVAFYLHLRDLSGGTCTFKKRISSATFDAPSTGTELGRDQYMHRDFLSMGALCAP